MPRPVVYEVTEEMVMAAAGLTHRLIRGVVKTGMNPIFGGTFDKHMTGKMGELAFYIFCNSREIEVKHTPFRRDYTKLYEYDDFIIHKNGAVEMVEVKTTTMSDPVGINRKYVLYNKIQYDKKSDKDFVVVFAAINPKFTVVSLIGWIPADEIAKFPIRRDVAVEAYGIEVSKLCDMDVLI